jgi:pre-mRNA-processing factor 40
MKEVQDLCQHDARWEALKSQGEKKQALAEYQVRQQQQHFALLLLWLTSSVVVKPPQTKRLKQEKENQKLKARKQRDAFLLMLAENTDIDARTRWKDAVAILQDDARYKNIEDARDREDLFQEFVLELEKKEKEDKRRARDEAVEAFNRVLKEFAAEGKISRKSIWADCKKVFVDVICKAEFRAMDDSDFRRAFQSYTAELEEEWRAAEKRRKLDQERGVAACQLELRALLEGLVREGQVKVDSRWKECVELEAVRGSAVLAKLRQHFPMEEDRDGSALTAACRQVFDAVQNKAYDQYRLDRRLLKDLLSKHSWRVKHDSTFADFKAFALKVGRVREAEEGAGADAEASKVLVEPLAAGRQAEDGEEVDDAPSEQLRAMMVERPAALAQIFAELLKKAQTDYEEEQQWVRKVERKFNSVLAENFYLPEHAAIPWDDAKKALQRRSVYDELGKSDRRRLFAEHMAALAAGVKIPERAAEPVLAERDEKSRHHRSRSNSHSNRAAPRGNSEVRSSFLAFLLYQYLLTLLRVNRRRVGTERTGATGTGTAPTARTARAAAAGSAGAAAREATGAGSATPETPGTPGTSARTRTGASGPGPTPRRSDCSEVRLLPACCPSLLLLSCAPLHLGCKVSSLRAAYRGLNGS